MLLKVYVRTVLAYDDVRLRHIMCQQNIDSLNSWCNTSIWNEFGRPPESSSQNTV